MPSHMGMRCHEFLERYSDYRDGLIVDAETRARILSHLDHCIRCMGYDALVARGVIALRATGEVEPSRRLRRALDERFATTTPAPPDPGYVRSTSAGVMAALMVAGVLILVGWAGTTFLVAPPATTRAERPAPAKSVVVLANPGVPFVGFTDLSVPAFREPAVVESATVARPQMTFGAWVNLTR